MISSPISVALNCSARIIAEDIPQKRFAGSYTSNSTSTMSRLNYYYLDYLHKEVGLTRKDVDSVPESGRADDACSVIADKKYVQKQLAEVSDEQLFKAVKSLCDDPELPTRKDAIMYIVWMVALSIKEEII